MDVDGEFLYVSDYFKTYRYPAPLIEKIEVHNYFLFHLGRVLFKSRTTKGRCVWFMISPKRMKRFVEDEGRLPIEISNR